MDDTAHAFLKRSLFSHSKISLLHMVGKGCNEARLNVVSELLNPRSSFIHGQKKKKKKTVERGKGNSALT